MKAERDSDPAAQSTSLRRYSESVMDVFTFILPIYYPRKERKSAPTHLSTSEEGGEEGALRWWSGTPSARPGQFLAQPAKLGASLVIVRLGIRTRGPQAVEVAATADIG